MAEQTKKPYITRLKEENEELKKTLDSLSKQVEGLIKSKEVNNALQEKEEKVDETIEVRYGIVGKTENGNVIYGKYRMPPKDALEALVGHYISKKNKAVPSPDADDANRNYATVYCRIVKRDKSTGRRMMVIKDLPLWIAAERAIEGAAVEIVSKQEYEQFYAEKEKLFNEWKSKNTNVLMDKAKEFQAMVKNLG
jgi:cell division septum initiation protein DivIVA